MENVFNPEEAQDKELDFETTSKHKRAAAKRSMKRIQHKQERKGVRQALHNWNSEEDDDELIDYVKPVKLK